MKRIKYILFVFIGIVVIVIAALCLNKKDDAQSLYERGNDYRLGKGVEVNSEKAIYWWHEAAKLGSDSAQYVLGECFLNGRGVSRDRKQAEFWYRKAAEQGNADAQLHLADLLGNNSAEALQLLQILSEQGNTEAMFSLGWYYIYSDSVRDVNKATYWYRKAAEQGDAVAQIALGDCYFKGLGVAMDYDKAVYWYRKAVDQGDPRAMEALAKCYEEGKGVVKDAGQAAYWRNKVEEYYSGYTAVHN